MHLWVVSCNMLWHVLTCPRYDDQSSITRAWVGTGALQTPIESIEKPPDLCSKGHNNSGHPAHRSKYIGQAELSQEWVQKKGLADSWNDAFYPLAPGWIKRKAAGIIIFESLNRLIHFGIIVWSIYFWSNGWINHWIVLESFDPFWISLQTWHAFCSSVVQQTASACSNSMASLPIQAQSSTASPGCWVSGFELPKVLGKLWFQRGQ